MLIYACKYKYESEYEFFVGKDINFLLTPAYWNEDQLLEIVMFKMPEHLKNLRTIKLKDLCQKIKV